MRYLPILLLLIIPTATADETPTDCRRVGVFGAMVAAERVAGYDEEQAGRINVRSKAGVATLRDIVHLVYESKLGPTAAQMLVWNICADTHSE